MKWFRRKDALPVSRKSASFLLGMGTGRATLSNAAFNQLALEGYTQNAVVHACIDKISASIASIEPQLYQRTNGKLKKIETHQLLDLLSNPNPSQSGKEFIRYLVGYYLTGGNAYVYGNGIDPAATKPKPPTELQLFNPGMIEIKTANGKAFPVAYECKPDASTKILFPVEQIRGRSAVMQFKTFNPLNPWYGLPPMLAAAYGIDIHNSGNRWNKKMLDNDARPSGALQVKDADGKPATLSDEQYNRLSEMLSNQFSGADNSGKPLLLEGGLEWQQMSMSAKDIDFLKGKDSSARDIGLIFGVPSQLLQIPGDSTFANYEQANLSYWTDTVIPLFCWLLEGFNRWLTPCYGDDLYLWYDEDSIPALEPRRKEKFTRVQAAEWMTIDEKRRATGMDDFPHSLGKSLLLAGRGVLLGEDGSIVSLTTNTNVDSADDPLTDTYGGGGKVPKQPDPAKHRAWLKSIGYTEERAERLTKLAYGE